MEGIVIVKKLRLTLVGLMIVQPLVVYFTQPALLVAVPVHYGLWGPDAWNQLVSQNSVVALCVSVLSPLAPFGLSYWRPNLHMVWPWWAQPIQTSLLVWSCLADGLVLIGLFVTSPIINGLWLLLNLSLILAGLGTSWYWLRNRING